MAVGVIEHNKYLAQDVINTIKIDGAMVVLNTVKSVAKHASILDSVIVASDLSADVMRAVSEAVGANVQRFRWHYDGPGRRSWSLETIP